MIPKVIHYCWFGRNPLPPLAIKCIDSWKKYLPDYEIKEWNEDNFDVNIIPYTAEAYKSKKYAFVSDYARFWILYKYGGLYFDTDVEVIRPMDDIIAKGAFMGGENESRPNRPLLVAPGLGLGANPGMPLYREILNKYECLSFLNADGSLNLNTVVYIVTDILKEKGLQEINEIQHVNDCAIYPKEYFAPIDTEGGRLTITGNTVCIHHYAASWMSLKDRTKLKIGQLIGPTMSLFLIRLKRFFIDGKSK